jgi:hypothetical protein
MPRNDEITRRWHLLRRLEDSHCLTLAELVYAVPDDYRKRFGVSSKLEAVGFSFVTELYNSQSCWQLIEGFAIFSRSAFPLRN